jgi:hypothetical protein
VSDLKDKHNLDNERTFLYVFLSLTVWLGLIFALGMLVSSIAAAVLL